MPLRRMSRLADGRWGTALLALVVALASAALVGTLLRRPAPPPAPAEARRAPEVAVATPAAKPRVDRTGARGRLLAARAAVSCGGVAGEAIFVGPEQALASVSCSQGLAQLRLSDGRELLARVRPGAPVGTSVLDLPGAAARFVPVGSATGLADEAPLVAALEGGGQETLGEATSRGLVPLDGRPLLRIDDAAGPLAGPVADEAGNLVGIAPSSPPDPARPWLAVPAEAFAAVLGRPAPLAWGVAVEQAADEDRKDQGDLWNRLHDRTVLLSATSGPGGAALVVARASAGRPPAEVVRLSVDPLARDCNPSGRVVDWRTGPRAFDGTAVPPEVAARIARIAPPPGGGAVWVGTGTAQLDCDLSRVPPGATLAIPGTDPPAPVPFPAGQVAPPPAEQVDTAVPPRDAARAAADAAEEAAAFEMGWRQAFQEANQRIGVARQHRLDLQAQRDEARANLQYALEQQLDGDVEVAKLEERRAQEALDDLDRRASLAAVPRAWRRAE